ncbi:hypothetical protein D039_0446A, partial [Vibrio parahaemolyticus EKP-028]
MQAFSIG